MKGFNAFLEKVAQAEFFAKAFDERDATIAKMQLKIDQIQAKLERLESKLAK